MHSDDTHALLAALTTEPALIFGSSAGVLLIGLDLIVLYSQQVRLLVAHEPAASGILPAFDESQQRHLETYQREGTQAAFKQIIRDLMALEKQGRRNKSTYNLVGQIANKGGDK